MGYGVSDRGYEALPVDKLETLLAHIEELIDFHSSSLERGGAAEETSDSLRTLREVREELLAVIHATSDD
jgi:hypothetical protein